MLLLVTPVTYFVSFSYKRSGESSQSTNVAVSGSWSLMDRKPRVEQNVVDNLETTRDEIAAPMERAIPVRPAAAERSSGATRIIAACCLALVLFRSVTG